ncbi:Cof-type HAD-IIB family hydrolase [Muricauda sp. JGD-17]|uniref:Cof-type HAD-IIB family hydrolase n=1 Tax=Flagellimonas ochracea TaxID=2696472 RepID=A0A964TFK8_9FLAO|nr:HAD family hydrolase [Allomuricauda ochracea]NAY93363.1 Cof-type HAD-IIB family hydrolase [Allomuricauda ochracea]
MDLSNIKMVVTDMDGTLLNSKHEVSDQFFELFYKLNQRGIRFVAASGRQYHSMADKLEVIKDDVIFIAENGALVKRKDEELSSTPLNQEVKSELLAVVDQIDNAHVMLCGKYTSYFDGNSKQFLNQLKEYYSAYQIVEDYQKVTDEIVKIAVYHATSAEDYIYPKVSYLEDKLKVKVSGRNWVDFNHVNAHKGNALQKVMDQYNIKPDQLLVFGDYYNDLEMLQLSDYSFAMANAHPNIKRVANFETTSNDDFGVERVLEKLL